MLLMSISTIAFAEDGSDDEPIDEVTKEETEIMTDSIGAEIRLLQLEKSITINILKGEQIVSILKNLDYNTTELEAILVEMEFLLEEVQAADPNATDAVQVFIDLKSDAKELTKEFRDSLEDMLDDETLNNLRERIREEYQDQNLTKKIRNRIRFYNRNQLHRLYGFIGDVNYSFLDEYKNGNITKEQAINQICKMVNNMTKEKRDRIFLDFKEYRIRARIKSMVCVENASQNFTIRKEIRLEHRLQFAKNSQNPIDSRVRAEMQKRMENRLNDIINDGGDGYDKGGDNGSGSGDGKENGGGGKQ